MPSLTRYVSFLFVLMLVVMAFEEASVAATWSDDVQSWWDSVKTWTINLWGKADNEYDQLKNKVTSS